MLLECMLIFIGNFEMRYENESSSDVSVPVAQIQWNWKVTFTIQSGYENRYKKCIELFTHIEC